MSSTLVSTPATTANTDSVPDTFLEESGNQDGEKEESKSNPASSASIDKFKSVLTPAPVPATNPWASGSRQSAESSDHTEPSVSRKSSQSKAPLDSVHWPKPDEGPSTTEGSNSAPSTIKICPESKNGFPSVTLLLPQNLEEASLAMVNPTTATMPTTNLHLPVATDKRPTQTAHDADQNPKGHVLVLR